MATKPLIPTGKIEALTRSLVLEKFSYGLGFKIVPLSQQAPDVIGRNAAGIPDKKVDCSGFVRWCLFHAAGVEIPDGSVTQHEWCQSQGYAQGTVADGHKTDGIVRLAFLTPDASGEGIGHVMIVLNGQTFESHGGKGPDSRAWGSQAFMSKCVLYEYAVTS